VVTLLVKPAAPAWGLLLALAVRLAGEGKLVTQLHCTDPEGDDYINGNGVCAPVAWGAPVDQVVLDDGTAVPLEDLL
jgi:hypothetical protein